MPQPRVQSLERALDLLEALAGTDELGVSDLAARTGLVPSTAHRLLGTLVSRGYAAQSPASGRYLLGYKLLELTSGLQDRLERLRSAARPHLEAIMERTGETTNLVVLEGANAVYIESVTGTRSVRLFTEIGQTIPAHTSGSGKALLAWRAAADVDGAARRRAAAGLDAAHADHASRRCMEDLAQIRRRGYATDDEEHELGVACVATPVLDATGLPLAAISVSGPTPRMHGHRRPGGAAARARGRACRPRWALSGWRAGARRELLGRQDADDAAAATFREVHGPRRAGVDRVVAADADAVAGLELGAALANDDLAAGHGLAGEHLHAEALGVGVAAVAGGAEALLMCHEFST